jgi:CheY-like chemotaxis protein
MAVPNILVIEDNPADVLLLKGMLEKELGPHHFEVLHDGESALAFIREFRVNMLTRDPCVIVLDLGLPRHNGITVLEEVRRSPALSTIQVVVISSFATPGQQERVQALGGLFREKPTGLKAFAALAAFIASICRDAPLPLTSGVAVN